MRMYLISGAIGLFFAIGFQLDDMGWLEPAVVFLFGDYANKILEWLYTLSVIFMFGIVFGIIFLLIPVIIFCVRFWYSWRVVLPAISLLVGIFGFIFIGAAADGKVEGIGMYLTLGGLGIYVSSAFLIGLEWARCGARGFRD